MSCHREIPALALACLLISGCALPDYYTPGGYSSTCHRRLADSTVVWSTKEQPRAWKRALVTSPGDWFEARPGWMPTIPGLRRQVSEDRHSSSDSPVPCGHCGAQR